MFEKVSIIFRRIFMERVPGFAISSAITVISLIGLISLLVVKTQSITLICVLSFLFFLGLIRSAVFINPAYKNAIPYLFCLVWLIPLLRVLIGAGGGPVSWDEMLYMDLARTSAAEPRVLNQYFHIYLLKIFYWLAGSTDFSAARFYWITVQSSVLILVYQSTIILTRRYSAIARILSGMAAILLFAAQPLVMDYIGVAYVDFTLELLFTLSAFLLIIADAYPSTSKVCLILLGLFFGLGLKTKEVAVVMLIPAFNLASRTISENGSRIRKWTMDSLRFDAGILIGLLILVILNSLILHRPLWGFTPQDIQNWLTIRTGYDPGLEPITKLNYFTELSSSASLCCLLMIGMILFNRDENDRSFVYKSLLAEFAALLLVYTIIPFQAYERYLIPSYPILAILAAPAVAKFSWKSSIRLITIAMMGIPAAILIWAMKQFLLNRLDPQIYNPVNLYAAFVLPIFVSGLMFSYIFMPGKENRTKYYVITALFFVAVFYPLDGVVTDIKTQAIQDRVTNRFKNIRQWNPDLIKHPDSQIFLSRKVSVPGGGAQAISADYARIILNLYYNIDLPTGIVTSDIDQFLADDASRYCYGLMPIKEFNELPASDREKIEGSFDLQNSKNKLLLYLTNPACQ